MQEFCAPSHVAHLFCWIEQCVRSAIYTLHAERITECTLEWCGGFSQMWEGENEIQCVSSPGFREPPETVVSTEPSLCVSHDPSRAIEGEQDPCIPSAVGAVWAAAGLGTALPKHRVNSTALKHLTGCPRNALVAAVRVRKRQSRFGAQHRYTLELIVAV